MYLPSYFLCLVNSCSPVAGTAPRLCRYISVQRQTKPPEHSSPVKAGWSPPPDTHLASLRPRPFSRAILPLECPPLLFSHPTRSSWVFLGAPGLRTPWGLNDKISRVTLLRAWCTVGPRGMNSSLNEPANADCRVWGFGRTFWRLPEAHPPALL